MLCWQPSESNPEQIIISWSIFKHTPIPVCMKGVWFPEGANVAHGVKQQTKWIYCVRGHVSVCLFPKHAPCVKPHCSSLWFWYNSLWSVCDERECGFFFAVDTLCGLKDSICSLLPLVVETLVHAYTSACLFSSYIHTFTFVNVCIHAFMCLWLRKQVKSWGGNESHLAGSSTVKKKKWEAYTQTVSIWKNERFISKDPFCYLF